MMPLNASRAAALVSSSVASGRMWAVFRSCILAAAVRGVGLDQEAGGLGAVDHDRLHLQQVVHELADVRPGGQQLGDQVRARDLLGRLPGARSHASPAPGTGVLGFYDRGHGFTFRIATKGNQPWALVNTAETGPSRQQSTSAKA